MAVPGGAGTAGLPIPVGAAPSSSDSSLSFHDAVPPQPPVSGLQVAVLLLVFGLAWLAVLGGTALVPPMDNIEQLDWVRSLQWGYYKHPPLPTALLWPWVQLFGLNGWVTYVLGTVVTLLALGLLWRMLRDMAGSRLATLALLAVLCITFYAGRLYYYNHNTVLLLGTVASAACAWQAFGGTGRRLGWWLLLGLALGITALGKYQIGLSVLSLIAFALHERSWRRPEQLRGLLLAGGVSALVFVPHVLWLVRSHGEAMDYALSTSVAATAYGWRSVGESLRWLADQLFNRALGAWLLLGIGVWRWRRTRPAEAPRQMSTVQEGAEPAGGDALARAQTLAELRGWEKVCALQLEYSLIERNIEREHIPAALHLGMGICPWSPLGGGLLTGKYKKVSNSGEGEGRLQVTKDSGNPAYRDSVAVHLNLLAGIS